MMNEQQLRRLLAILAVCTKEYRIGEAVEVSENDVMRVTTIDAMPHAKEAPPSETLVNCSLLKIGVDRELAEKHRDELPELLQPLDRILAEGPSYITLGAAIGDQGAAFCLMALGHVLGLWRVITPENLGFTGSKARQAAGLGYVMMTGYKREEVS